MTHKFAIAIGPPLAKTLEQAARAAISDVQVVSAATPDRPTLFLALSGLPTVSIKWEQGLFLVGQHTDCIIAVDARLVSESGEQIWQAVVRGQGQHETGQVANWPTAGQAEPAINQAITAVGSDFTSRLASAPEVVRYAQPDSQK